ncbi:DNA adenine methylase [Ornithobacterium rhinotracheale]|uniref:site-specific DNA-methyltransferase (adenine-specific) n=2 Tax=Ornithobacterium rhinotracheale TaxID=28251 RepID=I3ZXC6_ORNRL|nr:DNA adenine methylase [Ornithobacterium rhinotracheale]AFL96360.1 site-specific DNA methylase [Ornithobacterium rhinotracheale DSM 15997]AIP98597.1 DNA methyltransferase [Ornithobacterium rhinotracheale ORT-UMN 88]KGB67603.1 DNA methyltransferase [Ornithobacterium rhinotracheale H06-030791]MCK0201054.1 DNA adenine methylase [Ornithobacterium rhinotracheale]UOH63068.1 DNA adenine methylase [Ornithobacterium rhinotracheale]
MFYSPLRYPGGKNKLSAFIAKICIDNNINGHYVEPYSGGASVALFLLIEGYVKQVTINDKDRSIYAFWYCVLNKTKQLCEKIENAQLNIDEWRKQKKIQLKKDEANLLDLGFSTFYLNRTNRSGIINAGVIGGVEQKGNYLMDCRFNKLELIKRIKLIAKYKKNIRLYNKDANELIDIIQEEANKDNIIFYFDPPYYLKASTLYMNHYEDKNHKLVSDKIKSIRNIKWIVSYDNVSEIKKLYSDCSTKEFSFKHTAYQSRVGKEVLFFSNNIIQPEIKDYDPLRFKKAKETLDIIYKKTV